MASSRNSATKRTHFKYCVLYSYFYLRKLPEKQLASVLSDRLTILIDCGAFSAKNVGDEIKLDDYVAWLKDWKDRVFAYIALDKLQDPIQTDKNLQKMIAAGLKPIPVHVFGDGQERMDELFSYSDFVALGGLRRPHRHLAPVPYIKQKMQWANGRRVHLLIGKATVAYIPKDRVVGLSKIARLVHCFALRLQVQERMTTQIAETMQEVLKPLGVAVALRSQHSCMRLRGIKSTGDMITTCLLGYFKNKPETRNEFLRSF